MINHPLRKQYTTRRILMLALLSSALPLLLIGSVQVSRAQNQYNDTLRACPEGFVWQSTITFPSGGYDLVQVVGSIPPGGTGQVVEAIGPGTHTGLLRTTWNTPQTVGTVVQVFATVERPDPQLISLTATVVEGGCALPGDSSGGPGFNPGDGRVDPQPQDRLAIYCDAEYREIDIWGIFEGGEGRRLTVIEFDELTEAGQRGVRRTARNNWGTVIAYLAPVDPIFVVQWYWDPLGANGQDVWAKTFRCDFDWERLATSTPTRPPVFLPVITVTPSPTPSPLPTRAQF